MKCSSWISIKPKEKVLGVIKKINIWPRLYYYEALGSIYLSNTTCVSGKIDFANSLIDLMALNAEVTITFNEKILAENDQKPFKQYIQKNGINFDDPKSKPM